MDFTIRRITPEDRPKVEDFVHDHFLREMPVIVAFGLQDSPPNRAPSQRQPGADDIALQAVDSQENIIGVVINKVNPSFNLSAESPDTAQAVKEMTEFMNYVEAEAHLEKLPERNIELRIVSVREDCRKRGVARKLAEESVRLAREAGFKAMRVCCTSEYTAMVARSLGWREHYRLAYKDYPAVSGRNVTMKPTPPHEHLYYYVTDL